MFIPLQTAKRTVAPIDAVRIAHYNAKNGPVTIVNIGGAISKQIGLDANSRVRVLRGTDEDLGVVKIELVQAGEDKEGTYSVTQTHSNGAVRLVCAKIRPATNHVTILSTSASHTVEDGALFVHLPTAFLN
jgi:hypothetical protein